MRKVYLDYSATTPVAKAVLDEMMPYFSENSATPTACTPLVKRAHML